MARKPTPKRAARKQGRAAKPPPRKGFVDDENRPDFDNPPPLPGDQGGQGGGQGGQPPPDNYGIPGLPPELATRLEALITQYGGTPDAERQAMQWLMTTAWFKQEYAGFDIGFAKGMFSDVMSGGLSQYRSYKADIQRIHQQYYGTNLDMSGITEYIQSGYNTGRIEQIGQGYATAQANRPEWNYLSGAFGGGILTPEEQKAYGEQQAGIDTAFGQQVKNKVEAAMQRMQRVFQGTLGSSALGDQALGQRTQRKPDIQA